MKTKVFLGIGIRIIILCVLGMAATFIPEHLREFFGDKLHECSECGSYCDNRNDPDKLYDWGTRHYWYFWTMILLFLLSLVNVIVSIFGLLKKHYNIEINS